ncbi:M48 family metallopeptidase [Micromonospora musae]|uniref:M48 family metallopeptidase n=1 Tax=Micromonospora musae TaxID=1894970 RepID=UPI0033D2251F
MKTSLRAVLSIVLLIGFYVLGLGLVVALARLGLSNATDFDGGIAVRALLLGAAFTLFLTLLFALGSVLLARPSAPAGVRLTPELAPELWRIVRDLAARVAAREPDEIRLVAGANISVTDDARLLGLLPGRRRVIIGLPLLQAYTVDQLRAVLAHELGHYSRWHTSTVLLAHRGRKLVVATARSTTVPILRAVLTGYARLHVAVEQAVSQQIEYKADQYAVAAGGRDAMVGALREIRVVAAGWNEYLERQVTPAQEAGYLPADLFDGFAAYLAARRDEVRSSTSEVASTGLAWWDTHPPIGERIAALRFVPDVTVTVDGRPATDLLVDLDESSQQLQTSFLDHTGELLPWEQIVPILAYRSARDLAHPLYQAAGRLTGRDADLDLVLDLFAADRYADLARELAPGADDEEGLNVLVAAFEGAVETAAVDSTAATEWRHSWSGPPELLTTSGAPLPLGELVELAGDPDTVPAARERLSALGVRVVATAPSAPAPA